MKMKCCSKCQISKNVDEFYINNQSEKNNRISICKICTKAYAKEYRYLNQEKIKIKKKEYYNKNVRKLKEQLVEGLKRCTKCSEIKKYDDFHKVKDNKLGIKSICKNCTNKKSKNDYIKNNRLKNYFQTDKRFEKYLVRKYKITLDDYKKLIIEQKESCKICNKHQNELKQALCIDHNHETGNIRGLLCKNCNSAIGLLKDDVDLCLKAIKYLESYK